MIKKILLATAVAASFALVACDGNDRVDEPQPTEVQEERIEAERDLIIEEIKANCGVAARTEARIEVTADQADGDDEKKTLDELSLILAECKAEAGK